MIDKDRGFLPDASVEGPPSDTIEEGQSSPSKKLIIAVLTSDEHSC